MKWQAGLAVALASLALAVMTNAPARALAAPSIFWQSAPSEVGTARGIAADPVGGHIFVSDQSGVRIVEFTAWGELVKIWGWDVVASGPGDTAPTNQLEVCVPADGDVCKAGIAGTGGAGQFNSAAGLAVDSAGNIYAAEAGTPRRVQKFSPEGEFLLSFGGGVNQGGGTPSNPGNVCTAAHIANGDTCGAGKTGTGPGEFSGSTGSLRTVIAITPDDKVWVGDKERIQRFNPAGEYQGQVNVPGEAIQQLAVDTSGFLYVSYEAATNDAKEDVFKLNPTTGAAILTFEATNPRAISVASNGDVYVFDKAIAKIRHFDATGNEVEDPFGEDLTANSTGLATSSACGIDGVDVYFSNTSPSFVRAYGPIPDPDLCPRPQVEPQITSQYAASVSTDSAAVEAQINPFFWDDATYYVEYGTVDCSVGPCQEVLFPGAPLTSELVNEPLTARADLTGLEPDTTYHFRFVAESGGGGPVFGPDETFTTYRVPVLNPNCSNQALRTGTSAALPDCRAYEMVSPVEKNGGDTTAYFYEGFDADFEFAGLDQSTPDGAKLTYTASSSFADPEGGPAYRQYIGNRSAGGWITESIDPPMQGGSANGVLNITSQYKAFAEDLCRGWLIPDARGALTAGPTEGFRNLYRRDNCATTPAYTWLESSAPEPETCIEPDCPRPLFPDLQGVARDGECAVFRVNDALTPGAPRGVALTSDPRLTVPQLYLWCEGSGVRLVSVLANGTPFEGLSSAGTEEGSLSGFIGPGSRGEGHADTVENALSEDGTRVYWTNSSVEFPRLFLRFNADQEQSAVTGSTCTELSKACTIPVSPNLNKAQFWTASPDGSRAIYSVLVGGQAGNLSEFNFNPAEGKGASTKIAGQTLGVAGANEDATRIYFASREVCSGAIPNSEGEVAQAGKANLYLYETGQSCAAGELAFVGTLAEGDVSAGGGNTGFPSPLASVPRSHVARATEDGQHLTFVSAAPLTGYDNADIASEQADREVFLYDAGTGDLVCVSCNPSGARPRGADLARTSNPLWTAAWIPGYQHQLYGRRLISEDGNRLFFNSIDALALRDVNGAQDVYQWEAPGTGDCSTSSATYTSQNGGCVDLISSGQSERDSEWVEASASGDDVFFRTESSLVSKDPGSVDIYDARVGGGFPEPTPKAACEGDSCQAPPPPPGFQTPASRAFQGPGNAKPKKPRCAKGKVRRKGRCVKRKGKGKAQQRGAHNKRRAAR